MLVVFGAIIGVPVAAVAYFFLKLVAETQQYVFDDAAGRARLRQPAVVVADPVARAERSPRRRDDPLPPGHVRATSRPRDSRPAARCSRSSFPGIIIAAFATLSLGVVLGPEAPLIAIGSGMGVLAVHLIKRDAPEMASVVIGAAGSFAAIATLLGSPLAGAFLLMEAGGLGGALMGVVLVPGLLAAGIGSLIYIGLDDWTGLRDVLARGAGHPAGRKPDRSRVPLGDRDRRPGGAARRDHQEARRWPAADRRSAEPRR